MLQTLCTDGIAPRERLDYWNSFVSEALTVECANPRNPADFQGRIRRLGLGDVRIAEIVSDPVTVFHSRAHIARSPEPVYLLRMQLAGESWTRQAGRDVHLRPGDFTLCDAARPFQIAVHERASMLTLRIPREALRLRIASPERAALLPMSGNQGLAAFASRCLLQLWDTACAASSPVPPPRLAGVAIELIACAYATLPAAAADRSALTAALRARILAHIEAHLSDPELTPTSIARTFRITPRYLHMLFSERDQTLCRHILALRLDRARRMLTDPLARHRSVGCIAYEHGFKTSAHFCRAFRDRFGQTPTELRNATLTGSHLLPFATHRRSKSE